MNVIEAFDGPFAAWRGEPEPWAPWRTVMKVIAGAPLDDLEFDLFHKATGRTVPFTTPPQEAWFVVGRRGRKSATAAMIGVHAAVFVDWSGVLAPGETGRVVLVACDREQAKIERAYAEAIMRSDPDMEALIVNVGKESIELSTGITIQVATNSFRAIRGPAIVAAIFGEIAFWRSDESTNPDREVYRAVRPGMLTTRKAGALLIGISSPYAKRGLLWERYRDHHGRDDSSILVWQADTLTMNPAADPAEIEDAYRDDPEAAAAEYGAQFRSDVSAFLDAALVEGLARSEPLEIPPQPGIRYSAFCDPSGGRGDAMTLAICHRTETATVIDLIRACEAPFDPAIPTRDYAALLKTYGIRSVHGDRYGGSWVSEAFREQGIAYEPAPRPKSELYSEALPLFTGGAIELPPDRRTLVELAGLERRTSRAGRDSIDHAPRAHDDRANAVCGAAVMAEEAAVYGDQGPAIRSLRCYA